MMKQIDRSWYALFAGGASLGFALTLCGKAAWHWFGG